MPIGKSCTNVVIAQLLQIVYLKGVYRVILMINRYETNGLVVDVIPEPMSAIEMALNSLV